MDFVRNQDLMQGKWGFESSNTAMWVNTVAEQAGG